MPLPRSISLRAARCSSAALLLLLAAPACDDGKAPAPTKSAKGEGGKADKKAGREFDPKPAEKADGKSDGKDDAKARAKPDTKAEPVDPNDREPRGKADDPATAKALEEFAKSRSDKVIEVTAKPGSPEWFVQGLEAFRSGNIDPIVANFATDIVWDAVGSPLEPPSEGKAAVMARWEDLLIGIPDMQLHARRIFHHGDLVVMQVVLTGTHKGNFRGIAPTDKPVGTEVVAWIWHDQAGKANKVRVVYDEASLLAQMGKLEGHAVPPIPEVPTAAPEIIGGDEDAAATKVMKDIYAAGKNSWKLCETKLCAPGMIHHDARTGDTIDTPEGHKAMHDGLVAAFPDVKIKGEDITSFGNGWVVSYAHIKGTHKGKLGSLEATKKKVDLSYSEVARLDGGKIAESWGYSNGLEMLADLGLFTAPGKAGDTPAETTKAEPE